MWLVHKIIIKNIVIVAYDNYPVVFWVYQNPFVYLRNALEFWKVAKHVFNQFKRDLFKKNFGTGEEC